MCEHESAFRVGIVRYDKASCRLTVWTTFFEDLIGLDQLEKLGCLASRCSTHVENSMLSLDVEKDRWDHADDLLACDEPRVSKVHHEFVHSLQIWILFEKLSRNHHLKERLAWIERLEVHA